MWGGGSGLGGTQPAKLILEKQHDTAPLDWQVLADCLTPSVPTEYQMTTFHRPQVSRKIERPEEGVGSSPAAPTSPNPASSGDLRAPALAAPPRNTSSVPSPAPSLAPGGALCAGCSKAHAQLEVTGATALGDVEKCQVCRRLTRFLFTPEAPPRRRAISDAVALRAGRRAFDWFEDTGSCLFCSVDDAPADASHQEHCTFFVAPVAVEAPPLPPTSRDVGEPFGVKLTETAGWHSVEVRNAAGIVAYVHVGLESADAARWAALSWLRGQQRDVAVADAPALAEKFRTEALAYVPPVVTPAGDLGANLAHVDAPAVTPADDDPHAALCVLAAKIPESLFDRLGAWLQAREQTWEDLADEASSPDTIGEAKYVADVELVQVFNAIGGAL